MPAVALATIAGWPRWAVMWGVAVAVFVACKGLTLRRRTGAARWRRAAYLLAWPGMDAGAFLDARRRPARPRAGEWAAAAARLALGVAILHGVVPRLSSSADPYWLGWAGMVGLILCLHFGSFALLSCAWRAAGLDARPLMDRPLASTRLSDFWGRRWNTAFRDLTQTASCSGRSPVGSAADAPCGSGSSPAA